MNLDNSIYDYRPTAVVVLSSQRTRLTLEYNSYRIEILMPGQSTIEEDGWLPIVNCINKESALEAYEDIRHGMYVAENGNDK